MLYAYLKHFGGICASHTSATNMGTDWRDNDSECRADRRDLPGPSPQLRALRRPAVADRPQTQIGGYEPAGFVWNAFEKGYRLGFQSSQRPRQHAHELRRRAGRGRLAPGDHRRLQEAALLRRHRQHHRLTSAPAST